MSGAFVQAFHAAADASAATIAVTCTGSTAGNLHAVQVTWQDGAGTISCAVTNPTAYGSGDFQNAGGFDHQTFYLANIGSGSITVTATFTGGSPQFRRIQVFEYSGLSTDQATVLNAHQKNQSATFGTGTDAVTSNAATTNVDGCTIVGFAYDNISTTLPTQGTSFTSHDGFTNAAGDCLIGEDRTQATQGSIAATFTTTAGTDQIYVAMMAFKTPGAAGADIKLVNQRFDKTYRPRPFAPGNAR